MVNKLEVDKEFMQLIPNLLEEEYRLKKNIFAKGKLLKALAKKRQTLGGKHRGKLLTESSKAPIDVRNAVAFAFSIIFERTMQK